MPGSQIVKCGAKRKKDGRDLGKGAVAARKMALSLPSPRAFFAFLFTERLFTLSRSLEQATQGEAITYLRVPYANKDVFKFSYFPSIAVWNCLPEAIGSSTSLESV